MICIHNILFCFYFIIIFAKIKKEIYLYKNAFYILVWCIFDDVSLQNATDDDDDDGDWDFKVDFYL